MTLLGLAFILYYIKLSDGNGFYIMAYFVYNHCKCLFTRCHTRYKGKYTRSREMYEQPILANTEIRLQLQFQFQPSHTFCTWPTQSYLLYMANSHTFCTWPTQSYLLYMANSHTFCFKPNRESLAEAFKYESSISYGEIRPRLHNLQFRT